MRGEERIPALELIYDTLYFEIKLKIWQAALFSSALCSCLFAFTPFAFFLTN